ncbi:hypothetical protein A33I_09585 [Alkalihalophilus marmarensis DSM 21297]|uniref:Uncharacterized protein n=1 Tax=Alkalihalophilus marmarensis DSM 21297 TaxID=1188261 RepID=U6SR99_9BACI|nr:hypothetical protein A33I_09585 [Alkalihalophilus marmarensis DSM 21297]
MLDCLNASKWLKLLDFLILQMTLGWIEWHVFLK